MADSPTNQTTSLTRHPFSWENSSLPLFNSRKKPTPSPPPPDFITIIAHGLEQVGNNKAKWQQVADAASKKPFEHNSFDKFRPRSVYAFDIVDIFKGGEGKFQIAYQNFRKHVEVELAKLPRNENGHDSKSPKIVFVGHGLAEWLVKYLLVECSQSKDDFVKIDQVPVAGIIFVQPDNRYQRMATFNYEAFTESWVGFLRESGFSGFPNTGFSDREDEDNENTMLPKLRQQLQWIDREFQRFSGNDHLSCHTLVLKSPLSLNNVRDGTNIVRSNSAGLRSVMRVATTRTFWNRRLRHRDENATSVGAVKEIQVEPIDYFIKFFEGKLDDHNSGANSSVFEATDLRGLAAQQYFLEQHTSRGDSKSIGVQNLRSVLLSGPTRDDRGLISRDATSAGILERGPSLRPPDQSLSRHATDHDQWKNSRVQAEQYIFDGDLENADILCKRCVDIAELFHHRIDEPLRWRMRRALITVERGQYQDGLVELDHLLDKCYIYKEGLISDSSAWQPEPHGAPASVYRYTDLRSSWSMIPYPAILPESSSSITRSRRGETGQDVMESLRVLTLELLYQTATVLAATGMFQQAENRIKPLQEYFQKGQTSRRQKGNQRITGVRELKLSVDVSRLLALLKSSQCSFSEAKRLIEYAKDTLIDIYSAKDSEQASIGYAKDTEQALIDIYYAKDTEQASIDYAKDAEQPLEKVKTDISVAKVLTQLAEARILRSEGLIREALELSEDASIVAEKRLGKTNLTCLDAKCLYALLLVETSQIYTAEGVVLETSDIATRHLRKQHRFVLDMAHVLVSMYELQSRPLHALWTSESLVARSRGILGAQDQRMIHFQGQRAWIHVRIGNYKKGASLLQETLSSAEGLWGSTHPWAVTYLPKLALAHALLGRTSAATQMFHAALQSQIIAFDMVGNSGRTDEPLPDLIRSILSSINALDPDPNSHSRSPRQTHPDILSALQLWAEAETKGTNADLDLLLKVQKSVYEARKLPESFGEQHVLTLQAGLSLAKTLSGKSGHDLLVAEDLYNGLLQNAEKSLDPNHPLVLSARHGLNKVQLLRQTSTLESATSIVQFLKFVHENMSLRLGSQHPDALRLCLEVIEILRVVDEAEAERLSAELLTHVRSDAVWDQRGFESIKLQEQLAFLYFTNGEPQQALSILRDSISQLEAVKSQPTDDDVFEELLGEIRQAEKAVLKRVGLEFSVDERGEMMSID